MRRSRALRLTAIAGLTLCILLILAGTALAAGGPRAVTVDAAKTIGQIRSLQGAHWDPGPAGSVLSDIFKSIGVDAIRTHDAGGIGSDGVGDIDGWEAIDSIFPDLDDPDSDPNDPDAYNFGPTDQLIKNIRDVGAEVFFRVGRSNRAGHRLLRRSPAVVQQLRARHRQVRRGREARGDALQQGLEQRLLLRHHVLGDMERARLRALLARNPRGVLRPLRQVRAGHPVGRPHG